MRKLSWKKIVAGVFWLFAGIGTIVLFGAAMQKKGQKPCMDIRIEITSNSRHLFIDEKEVLDILNNYTSVKGRPLHEINLRAMEAIVEKNPWVQNAEMYVDNNQVLQVRISEREPVARVFTLQGNSFYLDNGALRLPLSEKLSARVPVFTGFPSDKEQLAKPDSELLGSIVKLSSYVLADSFWMAQVAQIDISSQSGFTIVPVIGDQTIVFGTIENMDQKFRKLYTFYQKAWLQNGINTYEKLDVQYDDQLVAVRRGTAKAMVDSLKAMELLKGMLVNNQINSADSSTAVSRKKIVWAKSIIDSIGKTGMMKPGEKANSVAGKNNKTGAKPLSKGVKPTQLNKQEKKSVSADKPKQPKAVMDKNTKE